MRLATASLVVEMPTRIEDLAYFAGLFDGEGSIMLVRMHKSTRTYMPRIVISMTDLPTMEWVHRTFPGGRLYRFTQSRFRRNENAKPVHRIDWTTAACLPILRGILPYLKTKSAQAHILIGVLELRTQIEAARKPYVRRDEATIVLYEAARERLCALNKRGRLIEIGVPHASA